MNATFRSHPYLVTFFALFAAMTIFFAGKFIYHAVYWSGRENEAIRPWMTVGYIGRSWDLDPRIIDETAGLPKPVDHPLTLAEIASQRGVPVAEVIADVEDALGKLKAAELLKGVKK